MCNLLVFNSQNLEIYSQYFLLTKLWQQGSQIHWCYLSLQDLSLTWIELSGRTQAEGRSLSNWDLGLLHTCKLHFIFFIHLSSSISRLDSLSDKWRHKASRRSISIWSFLWSRRFSSRICFSSWTYCAIFISSGFVTKRQWHLIWIYNKDSGISSG